jgi:spore coat protein U-like protein
MTNGASLLNYNLYTDATRTAVWGDGTGGTAVVSIKYSLPPAGTTQTDTHTVYGRAFAGQVVSVGSYLDTITVTLVF